MIILHFSGGTRELPARRLRLACRMANADNDNFLARGFIENQIGVGQCHDGAQATFAGELTGQRILPQKSSDRPYARLNVACALWRSLGDVCENIGQFGFGCSVDLKGRASPRRRAPVRRSQTHDAKPATGFREGSQFFRRELNDGLLLAKKSQQQPRHVILPRRGKCTGGINCMFEKFRHKIGIPQSGQGAKLLNPRPGPVGGKRAELSVFKAGRYPSPGKAPSHRDGTGPRAWPVAGTANPLEPQTGVWAAELACDFADHRTASMRTQ